MKVLVVEDEPLIRLGIVSTIEDAGYDVIDAASADEAIVRLAGDSGVEIVVTDVDMPGSMNGIQLARYARGRWPHVRMLVISGKVGVAASELPAGVQFMSKPFQDPKLLSVIATLAQTTP
ncbi:MAG: response regulator [Devosia sp.]